LIANRYEIMAAYANGMRETLRAEVQTLQARSANTAVIKAVKLWAHRDEEKVPAAVIADLAAARKVLPALDKMVVMRQELRQLWLNTALSRDQLVVDLAAWCRRAEDSGIAALRDFSVKLRTAHA
jgi:stearoyl-CoA desaturase (delta-9 desaturase)